MARYLVFALIFCHSLSLAAVEKKTSQLEENKKKLKEIKKGIRSHGHKMRELKKTLGGLEKNLGLKNQNYIQTSQKRALIEGQIYDLKMELQDNELRIRRLNDLSLHAFREIVVSSLDSEDLDYLLKKKLLESLYSDHLAELTKTVRVSRDLTDRIHILERQFNEYFEMEQRLGDLILEMEDKKRFLANTYMSEAELKEVKQSAYEKLEKKAAKLKALKKFNLPDSRLAGSFHLPLTQFATVKNSKEGLSFVVRDKRQVHSVGEGEVVYAGPLGSYGNLVMVDHGEDVRTILLGNWDIQVKKGDKVKSQQVLGNLAASVRLPKTLYFEVRLKHKAQKSIGWLREEARKVVRI